MNEFLIDNNIRYCILHGWHGLPEQFPSDLDIIVAPEDLPKLEETLQNTNNAYFVQLLKHETTCFYFVMAKKHFKKKLEFYPVDVATDYRRDGLIWFKPEELLEGRRRWKNYWVTSSDIEFKYLLVKKILKKDLPSHSLVRLQNLIKNNNGKAENLSIELLGRRMGVNVNSWIRDGNWERLEKNLKSINRILWWKRFKHDPLNAVRFWIPEIKRIWKRYRYPTGLFVVVLGPDGAGKTTFINNLQRTIAKAFRRTDVFHFRPNIFSKYKSDTPVTNPHGIPPRNIIFSLLKLFYYLADYISGYYFRIRPLTVRSSLVLFDRYFDDISIDPYRYRYKGSFRLLNLVAKFIPKPDIYIILDVDEECLLTRKKEVSMKELRRQRIAYRELASSFNNSVILNGTLCEKEVSDQATDYILDYLHQRYLARKNVWLKEYMNCERKPYKPLKIFSVGK